eukprot:NODE_6750_length_503_cov_22.023936_g6584_i0.p1 GENE.NODE_6750_length_503_cov_22.023936_g6584_i0~~NODE_6750_length_503_cov_22.023936_g6584_i0.p1  ORF type:complete len:159 (+),score=41.39 NODE_6750_length_503_cov_22.023936_g6584_i0:56-478(+)
MQMFIFLLLIPLTLACDCEHWYYAQSPNGTCLESFRIATNTPQQLDVCYAHANSGGGFKYTVCPSTFETTATLVSYQLADCTGSWEVVQVPLNGVCHPLQRGAFFATCTRQRFRILTPSSAHTLTLTLSLCLVPWLLVLL